jgi:ribosomal-protein-alanine N-acetyltransferase
VRITNRPAQELYRRFGFVPAGIRKGYYVETNEDALVMWANDVDTDEHHERLERLAATIGGTTIHEDLDR